MRRKTPRRSRPRAGLERFESKARATVDRFEDDLAVLVVDGREEVRPRSGLPPGTREGDVLDLATLEVDAEATEALREEVRAARERAGKGKPPPPGGSFEL